MDGESGQLILSSNGDETRPVASTVKMMTAILSVEYASMYEEATVSSHAAQTPEYSIGLKAEQKIAVGELLKVALIRSSNDAAMVLAEHIAGDEGFFAHLMSKKAFLIGASNTRFSNASGLPGGEQFSTCNDLAQIGRYAQSHPQIKELVATRQSEFKHPSYSQPLRISNTNSLLGSYQGADGIKTGTANAAGKCLVASATRDGRHLIAVVLKSSDRAGDCMRLLNYGFKESYYQQIINASTPFKELRVLKVGDNSPDIEKKVNMKYELQAPLSKGQEVGSLVVYADGKLVESMPLLCGDNITRQANLFQRIIKDFILP
jgi:D-alanyl-D-alanine carboxypeptidase (penicillin-binding protein 5/6)